MVDEPLEKRLVYIKALYWHGQQHAKSDLEFDRMIAIHHFDNAVELMLRCIATKEGIDFGKRRHVYVPELIEEIEKKLKTRSVSLSNKLEILRLHDLRGDIQHWGDTSISLDAVSRYQVYAGDFLNSALKDIFGLEFENLSLAMLVKEIRIRDFLMAAEAKIITDPKTSMKNSSVAFCLSLEKELERINLYLPSPSFEISPDLGESLESFSHEARMITAAIAQHWERKMQESLKRYQNAVELLCLSVDISEHSKFKSVTPITVFMNGQVGFQKSLSGEDIGDFTKENAKFCFDFVLKHVLRWQEKW